MIDIEVIKDLGEGLSLERHPYSVWLEQTVTEEFPISVSPLGQNGFVLLMKLDRPPDLRSLLRLGKCKDRSAMLEKVLAAGLDLP